MRRLPPPVVAVDSTLSRETDRTPEVRRLDPSSGQGGNDIAQALAILEDQVAAEEARIASTTLAGLALSAATGGAPREDEQVLLAAMAVLHFARYAELGDQDD